MSVNQRDDNVLYTDVALAERQTIHIGLEKEESLLQVIEADDHVDAMPVEHALLDESALLDAAIDLLVVQQVEEKLK